MNFQGQTVSITAPSRQLSRALSLAFEQEGAVLVPISDDVSPVEFTSSQSEIDVLLLVPPFFPVGPTLGLSESMWHSAIQGTLIRFIDLIRLLGAGMVARNQGCILIFSGLSGSTGFPGWAVSSAVEGALFSLVRSLACEWAQNEVRLLSLAHGPIAEEPVSANENLPSTAEIAARTPLGRSVTSAEIAETALYLAGSHFLTSSQIRVDGGWTSWGLLK